MASIVAGLIASTKVVIEKVSSLVASADYSSRTVASEVTQISKTKAVVSKATS